MKKLICSLLAFAAAGVLLPLTAADDTRTIRLVQDDAQVRMVTKIYPMKYVKALDIQPFVAAAAKRYSQLSNVRAQNYSAGKIQYLLVTTGEKFIPYMDEIITKLDQPGKYSKYGSRVEGTGVQRMVYYPQYRDPEFLKEAINNILATGIGSGYAKNGILYWKDEWDNMEYTLDWLKMLDRPIPQAKLTFRYYEVRESTLKDVGVDYLAWKNGPGMNLFNAAYSSGRLVWDKVLNPDILFGAFNWSYGGFATAPAFDLSFIRLLQQSGNAKVAAEATVTVLNNNTVASTLSLDPSYGKIQKDADTHASSIGSKADAAPPELSIKIKKGTTICFDADAKEVTEDGHVPATVKFYQKNKGNISFGYTVEAPQAVEYDNFGNSVVNSANLKGFASMNFGKEQLFYKSVVERDIEQTTGIPFLCQIPVIKYLFGTTTTVKEKTFIVVTVEANLVHPENNAK
ncbi:MAG: hypothetical protein J6S53_03295 [Lentisphaeria bacterium]|nr:hypothetical protein [Lentisphaeria bacterium]